MTPASPRPTPSTDRRAREQAAVREKILAAARRLFIEQGYEAVSLRKIAEAIEYTAPALYTHFKDKGELLQALCREDFGALTEAFKRLERVDHPLRRIVRLGRGYIRFAVEHPQHYRLMFMCPPPTGCVPDEEALAHQGDPDHDGYAHLQRAVREAMDRGMLRPELTDAELVAQVLWAGVHGVASLEITHQKDPWINWSPLERRAEVMTVALLRGLVRPEHAEELGP